MHNADIPLHNETISLHNADIPLHNETISLHNADIPLHNKTISLHNADKGFRYTDNEFRYADKGFRYAGTRLKNGGGSVCGAMRSSESHQFVRRNQFVTPNVQATNDVVGFADSPHPACCDDIEVDCCFAVAGCGDCPDCSS